MREQADAGGGDTHHPDGHHQHPLAPETVAEVAKDNSAQRAKKKPDAEGGKRGKGAHRRADLREKFAVEHQRGGNAIEKKIVPVDHGAGKAAPCRPPGPMQRIRRLAGLHAYC